MSMIQDIIKTFCAAGINIMSADHASRILAVLYIFGGDHESFTYSPKWMTAVKMAQARANIDGSEIADCECVASIKKYVAELAPGGLSGARVVTDWAREMAKEYGLFIYEQKTEGGEK